MDGFIDRAEAIRRRSCKHNPDAPLCSQNPKDPDVMGYHDWREIPNYWRYAGNFVLQDRMFQSDASWSLPSHLFMVSGWSAKCSVKGDPMSCAAAIETRRPTGRTTEPHRGDSALRLDEPSLPPSEAPCQLALLRREGLSARLRRRRDGVQGRSAKPEDTRNLEPATVVHRRSGEPPNRQRHLDSELPESGEGRDPALGLLGNAKPERQRTSAGARQSRAGVRNGPRQAVMGGPNWSSTAIFVAWDDWGGFTTTLRAPGRFPGLRFRVPGLLHSPDAAQGIHRSPDAQLRRVPQFY